MKNTYIAAFAASVIVLSGCSSAQKASEVQSVRMPIAPYLKMSCKELASEQSNLVREAQAAGAEVDAAYDSDKTAELVAWILFAPAALMLEGNQAQASRLASTKGQLEAVQEAQKVNKCTDNG
ncbi:MAG: hypothetical protein O3A94_10790 [Proteobacteria bacterium]|nr:hypothetical protein [Pseudomonadota bacterium]